MTVQPGPRREASEYDYPSGDPSHTAVYLWEEVCDLLPPPPARLVDFGCGNGAFAEHCARLGYQVSGIDPSGSGIARARERESSISFEVGSVYDDAPESWVGGFDVAVGLDVIEHLSFPRCAARWAASVLRPGGFLVLSTPYHGYLKNVAVAVSGRFDHHFDPLWDHGHVKFFSKKKLSLLLVEEGFDPVKWRFSGRLPLLWKTMVVAARVRGRERPLERPSHPERHVVAPH